MSTPVAKTAKIAVLCGGLSSERDVSLRSGKNCHEALLRLGYAQAVLMDMDRAIAQRLVAEKVDVVFLALHGKYGEDGAIQGLLDILGIPYTGNRLAASAITMDKHVTKQLLKQAGLPVIPSVTVNGKGDDSERLSALAFPVMVKPATEGSSVGMQKVTAQEGLASALVEARQYDTSILVEEFVAGKSITVGVFDKAGEPVVTPILELRTKTEWYDYEAKYTEGMTEFVLPAELAPEVTQTIQAMTLEVHQILGCSGLSRTDYIVTDDDRVFILEVNTIPGMTNLSDLPAQANCLGVGYDELVDCILQTAR